MEYLKQVFGFSTCDNPSYHNLNVWAPRKPDRLSWLDAAQFEHAALTREYQAVSDAFGTIARLVSSLRQDTAWQDTSSIGLIRDSVGYCAAHYAALLGSMARLDAMMLKADACGCDISSDVLAGRKMVSEAGALLAKARMTLAQVEARNQRQTCERPLPPLSSTAVIDALKKPEGR